MSPADIRNKTILLSPLDWGMGHTTRCVSLVRKLSDQDNQLFFAGDSRQIRFMEREFPGIQTEKISGYDVKLDPNRNTYIQMMNQAVKINGAIKKENNWVKDFLKNNEVDVIISDNRYGFRSSECTSIILTHQLNLQLPFFPKTVSTYLKKMINRFDYCWIPDSAENPVCGDLIKADLDIPKIFIGRLNRFKKVDEKKKYNYLIVLSGPEPSRSKFETAMKDFLKGQKGKSAIVGAKSDEPIANSIDQFKNPSTGELQKLIGQSEKVISRAGYTTIMEMLDLGKEAILIPTKGQYEQEYLAENIRCNNLDFKTLEDFLNLS